ncbi:hypothetical protein [Kordiimonas sp.]|uniref:hypothetical protein n=1 Tax=Kordiimonas sp. TaxID=1970157 RepID=UPI003A8FCBD1
MIAKVLKKIAFAVVLWSGALALLAPVQADAMQTPTELTQMFSWWNKAFKTEGGFTREGFARHFTEDGAIMIDGHMRVQGLDNLVAHFQGIQSRTDSVEIVLPFKEEFRSGDKIFTYHLIKSVAGEQQNLTHAMGYAEVRDGKISLIHLVRSAESDRNAVNAIFDN